MVTIDDEKGGLRTQNNRDAVPAEVLRGPGAMFCPPALALEFNLTHSDRYLRRQEAHQWSDFRHGIRRIGHPRIAASQALNNNYTLAQALRRQVPVIQSM